MYSKKQLDAFFNAFLYGVHASGGDGDGELSCQNHYDTNTDYYKEVADAFGEYEQEYYDGRRVKIKDSYTRFDEFDKGYVIFTDMSNENFIISKYTEGKTKGRYDDIFMVI